MGDFKKLDFNDQVITIANDIKEHFWREDAKIIANSFGGYLFLHALSKLDPYIGKILLLSPIIVEFSSEEISMGFIPLMLIGSVNLLVPISTQRQWTAPCMLDQRTGKAIQKMSLSLQPCLGCQSLLLLVQVINCP